MEPRFGHDFGHVRVHSGPRAAESARSVSANAYTVGNHIVLGSASTEQATLAHELAHVVQQSSASAGIPSRLPVGDPADPDEREADRLAADVITH